jgi:predicted nuclease with TOPRIM domain
MFKLNLIPFLYAMTALVAHGADTAQPKAAAAQPTKNSIGQGAQATFSNPDYSGFRIQLVQQTKQIEEIKEAVNKLQQGLDNLKYSFDASKTAKIASGSLNSSEYTTLYQGLQALDAKINTQKSEIVSQVSVSSSEGFSDLKVVLFLSVLAICAAFWYFLPKKSVNPPGDSAGIAKLLDEKLDPLKSQVAAAARLAATLEQLRKSESDLHGLKTEVAGVKQKLGETEKSRQSDAAELSRLNQECSMLRENISRLEVDLGRALESARLSEQAKERAASDLRTVSDENRRLSGQLDATQSELSATKTDLSQARNSTDEMGMRLAASFESLYPRFLSDPEVTSLLRKLHVEALAGSVSAVAAWSTLTAFASAEADTQAKDFQLHILKRLGAVLVNYWKGQGSPPKDSHERLTHWARCLNEQAKGRYNLFVPAIGAPVDRTKMTTASSASIVQEVLCWQVRNPAGANYSLAEVA